MKYELGQKQDNKIKITITLDSAEWEKANEAAYLKEKGKYAIQGFRKGKVPRKILESTYGKGIFYEEAFNEAFPIYYTEVLEKETKLIPVDRPEIDVKKIEESGIVFDAIVTLRPDVKISSYKGIKVDKKEYNVTNDDVKAELDKALDRAGRLVPVEGRAAKDGDTVIIDYSGSIDGVKFDGGTAQNQSLVLGSKSFVEGFESQIIGMNAGDKKDIKVTFPKDYAENLAGKNAIFNIVLKEIKVKELPELNDDFAKDVSEFETLDAYKSDIKDKLNLEAKKKAETEMEDALIEAILKNVEVNVPQCMIDEQLDYMLKEMEYKLSYQGLKIDDYFKYMNTTVEDFKKSAQPDALKAVKTRLLFQEIIELEKIEADEKSLDEAIAKMAEKANKPVAIFKRDIKERELEYYKNQIVTDKLFDLLKKYNPAS